MQKEREFFIKVIVIILIFTGLNYFIDYKYSEEFTGDLGRLAKIDFGKEYNEIFGSELETQEYYLKYNSVEKEYDVITIGDSFSQQEKDGYQNYLSKISGLRVMNLKRYNNNFSEPEQTAFILLNSGYFDEVKTKYLIVESVERYFITRGIDINLDEKTELNEIYKYYENLEKKKIENEKRSFFNVSNVKFIINKFLYKINNRAFYTQVYKQTLKEEMFSVRGKELYFYIDDIKNLKYTKENMEKTNKNLNILSEKLKEKGIELIIMPAVNKYTFYQDYIEENKFEKSLFFEEYSKQIKNYIFVDTKEILTENISNEKDLFYLNDTHWSYKASKKVAEKLDFILNTHKEKGEL